MIKSLHDANIEPHQVDYINAHGTSTPYNDKFETIAIKKVFGDHARKVSHQLHQVDDGPFARRGRQHRGGHQHQGHRDRHRAPTINYETPDPDCDLDYTPNVKREAKIDTVLTDNLGFGGHNAALVFRRH